MSRFNLPSKYRCSPERKRQLDNENAYEQLRAAVNICENSIMGSLDDYTLTCVLLNVIRAIRYSAWDLTVENLTREERAYAAEHGVLSLEACKRLEEELG